MMIATKIDDYDSPATPHPQQAPREFFFKGIMIEISTRGTKKEIIKLVRF